MKVVIILGTRPEIIKLSPLIRECEKKNIDYFILHTGQHYSHTMDSIFFQQLELPEPKYNLNVGSSNHGEQTGKMMTGIEGILERECPDIALLQGDTNTVLAGAIVAAKQGIEVGHVEAGLRSYDRRMPEEINRVLTDHCSDLLFSPTEKSRETLIGEGIPDKKIFITGNTIVDAVFQNLEIAYNRMDIINDLRLKAGEYFLATVHRQENVDEKKIFDGIIKGLELVAEDFGLPVIYPIHPRAKKRMEEFEIKVNNIELIDPLDYPGFLQLENNARIVLTDSGGVQEETCILNVPCVTLRDNTERPETIEAGSNMIAGTSPEKILDSVRQMVNVKTKWANPFGDGTAGEKIIGILESHL